MFNLNFQLAIVQLILNDILFKLGIASCPIDFIKPNLLGHPVNLKTHLKAHSGEKPHFKLPCPMKSDIKPIMKIRVSRLWQSTRGPPNALSSLQTISIYINFVCHSVSFITVAFLLLLKSILADSGLNGSRKQRVAWGEELSNLLIHKTFHKFPATLMTNCLRQMIIENSSDRAQVF